MMTCQQTSLFLTLGPRKRMPGDSVPQSPASQMESQDFFPTGIGPQSQAYAAFERSPAKTLLYECHISCSRSTVKPISGFPPEPTDPFLSLPARSRANSPPCTPSEHATCHYRRDVEPVFFTGINSYNRSDLSNWFLTTRYVESGV